MRSTIFRIPSAGKSFLTFPPVVANNPTLVAFPVGDEIEVYQKDNVICDVEYEDGTVGHFSMYTLFPTKETGN